MHRMPYLYRLFSANEPLIVGLFCRFSEKIVYRGSFVYTRTQCKNTIFSDWGSFVYTNWVEDDYRVAKRVISTIRRLNKMIGFSCKRAL